MSKFHINFFHEPEGKGIRWHRVWIAGVIVVVVIGAGLTGLVAYGKTYDARVAPRILLNGVSLGGMTEGEIKDYLQTMSDKLTREGVELIALTGEKEQRFRVQPPLVTGETLVPLVSIHVEEEAKRLLEYKKHENAFVQALNMAGNRLQSVDWRLSTVQVHSEVVVREVKEFLTPLETQPQSAELQITAYPPEEELAYTISTSTPGIVFPLDHVESSVRSAWEVLRQPHVTVKSSTVLPDVTESELIAVADQLPLVFGKGAMKLTYTDSHTKETSTWTINEKRLGAWIDVDRDDTGQFVLTLNTSSTADFLLKEVEEKIGVEPQNAKFDIGTNGKVVEFRGSRPGVGVDVDVTTAAIVAAFQERKTSTSTDTHTIPVTVKEVEPEISTGDVNDLGIGEIIGSGVSDFSGSPANRIANIKNAAYSKLHGTLIKPGEEFSLNAALRPYTTANGYLYEKVIVGNRITKEVGGGLCQIGTTMFRAAMNSGLPITARTNHGLVVSYYNDPSNGNPGTDATIYDGWPDFKFVNDTAHHILITTYMDVKTGKLQFTFWGTNDGRKGYYTPPKVSNWVSPGPYKEIITTDLPPGVKECQNAYKGANTSFTYVRILPNGEKEEKVFTSTYRAVPAMCFVGKSDEVTSPPCPEGEECSVDPAENDSQNQAPAVDTNPNASSDTPLNTEVKPLATGENTSKPEQANVE